MPRPSSLASTTPTSPTSPNTQPPSPPPAARPRGNPTLALIPRCGARTRAGCPCRAPALRGKLRCRMHGGRSTGPRTADGMARLRAAHTTHGHAGAEDRASNRHHVNFLGRTPLRMFAIMHRDRLPPELAARMAPMAPELEVPPRPTCGISHAEDRALRQAEAAALAPWKQAMADARQARRAARAARAAASAAKAAARARPHAPALAASAAAVRSVAPASAVSPARPKPHAPIPPAPARPAPHLAPPSARAAPSAEPHAPDRAAPGPHSAPPPANPAAPPKPHAPIPPAAAQPAPPSARAAPVPTPHAPNTTSHGPTSTPAPANQAAQPEAHAPERPRTPDRVSRPIPVHKAARRWLRQQQRMHPNLPEGSRQ
jgi:hypothetical protein